MQMAESPVTVRLRGACTGGTGPDLTGYPHLTYAPAQWGEGVRFAKHGEAIADIVERCEEQISDLRVAAAFCRVTLRELFDAILYSQER
jgi:uncharacterized protein (DUF433 family)